MSLILPEVSDNIHIPKAQVTSTDIREERSPESRLPKLNTSGLVLLLSIHPSHIVVLARVRTEVG